GRWFLLHRLRRPGRAGRVRADQPDLAVRPVQPRPGEFRFAAGLVHGHAGRLDPPVRVVGDPRPVRPIYRAGSLLAYGRAAHDPDRAGPGVPVHRGPADEGPRETPPVTAAAGRAGADVARRDGVDVLHRFVHLGRQRPGRRGVRYLTERHDVGWPRRADHPAAACL